ncbi:MAG: ABC transporter permease [Acidobacteria bacterium]|nr:ABC transporter permease [Acidobacteriota bacterium]
MNEIILLALDSLRKNKLRSFLTVLGVVIGVATVIGMSSIIAGLNGSIASSLENLGSNLIFVVRIGPVVGGRAPTEIFNRKFFTLEDAEAVRELPLVREVAPVVRYFSPPTSANSYSIRYRDRTAKNTIIEGVTAGQEIVMNLRLSAGRWFNQADDEHRANVAVLGYDTVDTIFPAGVDPIGKEVELLGTSFRVIGVLEKRTDAFGPGRNQNDNVAEIPVSTFRKLLPNIRDIQMVVKPVSQEAMSRAIDQIENLLRHRRGVPPNKASDFDIMTQDSINDIWNQISGGIFAVMLGISSIALLVGGVGVMNIMLVSVTERTREIGIRKAIGARQRDILMQFLFEAMTLTAVGGILGIVAGSGITFVIRALAPFLPATVSAFWVVVGFAVSVGTGLIFGMYPAYRAAMLSPIEALRYE